MRAINTVYAVILLLVLLPLTVCGQSEPDFAGATNEATRLLQEYLRIDTTNPPGHEKRAAQFLKTIFDRAGIENEILDQGDDRANIIARIPGNGVARPLILLNHLDVVPADAERWQLPPFSGEIRDGYIWGRGAIDMKGTAICQLMTMLAIKRAGLSLTRDLIFIGTADEEEGTVDGVKWLIAHHREKFRNAEFVLTEGNTLPVKDGKTAAWNVAVTEKANLWLKLIASGKAGHASVPEADGAVARIVRAVSRLQQYQPPVRLLAAVENYFHQLAVTAPPEWRNDYAEIAVALRDPARAERLLADANRNAYLRSTIAVTGLSGSNKVNVIPGEATATIDCRLLPGDEPEQFLATLKSVVDDASIRFEIIDTARATQSSIDTELFRAIERARNRFEPGVPVLTPPLTSTTDAGLLREIGMTVYGFEPFHLSTEDDASHGDNERLSLINLRFGMEVTYAVVIDLCCQKFLPPSTLSNMSKD